MDRATEAVRFNQLIEKNGTDSWLATLAEDLGPWAQIQLGDIASLLEVMNNFYHWTAPRTTLHSLIAFSCCLLVTLVGDMELCVRIVMLIVGLLFFFSFPISSRYPKYRYLVSPLKWLLWNIPTQGTPHPPPFRSLAVSNILQSNGRSPSCVSRRRISAKTSSSPASTIPLWAPMARVRTPIPILPRCRSSTQKRAIRYRRWRIQTSWWSIDAGARGREGVWLFARRG